MKKFNKVFTTIRSGLLFYLRQSLISFALFIIGIIPTTISQNYANAIAQTSKISARTLYWYNNNLALINDFAGVFLAIMVLIIIFNVNWRYRDRQYYWRTQRWLHHD